jgi:exopolyphosphatase/guanosine-5'-triphosphate,3'-diphosphate pyrophosphatase
MNHDHERHVAIICEELFECCAEIHGMGLEEGRLLTCAALLHDIGWCGGQNKHHKRSQEMIIADPPKGLSPREVAIVANVARYHRKGLPKLKHEAFAALDVSDREIVRHLASLIRIADGLDRTHQGMVHIVGCSISADAVVFRLRSEGDCSAEVIEAKEKADLFEEVFLRKAEFIVHGVTT